MSLAQSITATNVKILQLVKNVLIHLFLEQIKLLVNVTQLPKEFWIRILEDVSVLLLILQLVKLAIFVLFNTVHNAVQLMSAVLVAATLF